MRISDWSSDVCSSDLTNTRRYGVIASLNYDINDDHHVRLAYTWDRARHRQTGSTNLLQLNGEPIDVFQINNPLETVDGFVLNKRDRLSYAIMHPVSCAYRGEFGDLLAVLDRQGVV